MPEYLKPASLEQYIIDHLDEALEQGRIRVYYQPVIRTITRQLCGMEALARWESPELGLLYPGSFIPVLEQHRLIHRLDSFVVREVCACYRQVSREHRPLVPVSVNLSRLDYELCDIFSVVESCVREYRVPREALCIEITESVLNNNETLMSQYLHRFQSAGYQVWMDDFGSGYSSLNVLKDYQFDELKIDMRFLSDFHQRSKKILASIVHMAKEINIQTLVEGVETEEQFQFLHDIGCEKAQGYLFSQPMPFGACMEHIKAQGIGVETPVERSYYDLLGKVNVLSANPFITQPVQRSLVSGKEMNSIPLAILELRQDRSRLLYTNGAFGETIRAVDWKKLLGMTSLEDGATQWQELSRISDQLRQVLEESRSNGEGKMYFVDHDEYFELKAQRIAKCESACGVLLRVNNLSRNSELLRQSHLDAGLRQIYTAYNRVILLDLKANTATPLYLDYREDEAPERLELYGQLREFCRKWIFWKDQGRYMAFTDPSTMAQRVLEQGKGFLSSYFRVRIHRGKYVWQVFLLVRIEEERYFLMARNAEEELRSFLEVADLDRMQGKGERYSPELLWRNITQNTPLKLFWKDEKRRFLGASQSFLDFYGFHSQADIVGKTDEDMGWHLHPDLFRDFELDVIENGAKAINSMGNCIIRGENKSITANKMPLYDDFGKIIGLMGYFFQMGEGPLAENESDRNSRTDTLTGVLNARGLSQELYAYRDEFDLRQTKYGRIDVYIDDFMQINQQYGFAFGDELIRTLAKALVDCCGNLASIGRIKGAHFVILCQYVEREDLERLAQRIRDISSTIQRVQDVPFTLYLSAEINTDEYTADAQAEEDKT